MCEVVVPLLVENAHFAHRFAYLIRGPQGLLSWAEQVVFGHVDVHRYRVDLVNGHVVGDSMRAVFDVLWCVLLKALLDTVLEHVLEGLH